MLWKELKKSELLLEENFRCELIMGLQKLTSNSLCNEKQNIPFVEIIRKKNKDG